MTKTFSKIIAAISSIIHLINILFMGIGTTGLIISIIDGFGRPINNPYFGIFYPIGLILSSILIYKIINLDKQQNYSSVIVWSILGSILIFFLEIFAIMNMMVL